MSVPSYEGRQPIFVTVDAVIENHQDKILVLKRKDGKWCLPGGFVEPNETLKESMIREVFEETGLEVDSQDWWINDHTIFDDPFRSERGRIITYAFHVVWDELVETPQKIILSSEHTEAKWEFPDKVRDWFEDHDKIVDTFIGFKPY